MARLFLFLFAAGAYIFALYALTPRLRIDPFTEMGALVAGIILLAHFFSPIEDCE